MNIAENIVLKIENDLRKVGQKKGIQISRSSRGLSSVLALPKTWTCTRTLVQPRFWERFKNY